MSTTCLAVCLCTACSMHMCSTYVQYMPGALDLKRGFRQFWGPRPLPVLFGSHLLSCQKIKKWTYLRLRLLKSLMHASKQKATRVQLTNTSCLTHMYTRAAAPPKRSPWIPPTRGLAHVIGKKNYYRNQLTL